MIFSIDPGTTKSAFVILNENCFPIKFGKVENEKLREIILSQRKNCEHMVCEEIKSYGNAMGDTTIQTCVWIGRFIECWGGANYTLTPRKTVCALLCGTARAKDSNIRRALLDLYSVFGQGGGSEPTLGTKASPGPLYGISSDVFSALAVAVTFRNAQERLRLMA